MIELIKLSDNLSEVEIHKNGNYYFLTRKNYRNKIVNTIHNVQVFDEKNECNLKKIDEYYLLKIKERLKSDEDYSSCFVFFENDNVVDPDYTLQEKSGEEHLYTSTGIKFWRHQSQMFEYKNGGVNTVISTHVSPEGVCNLKCPYCSVTYRKNVNRIKLNVIQDYILKLKSRGLKAVILTGGGEPTLYKQFNELVRWINSQNLSVALITNGTNSKLVDDDVWSMFSWIRVSVNIFKNWEDKISIPINLLSKKCVVGMSHVFTVEHEDMKAESTMEYFNKISKLADKLNSTYVRILPNCLLNQEMLIKVHNALDHLFLKLNDKRFFHQYKFHNAPKSKTCHQSYFRPYLSEEPYHETGESGTVYPCDSVVLNENATHFSKKYQLCSASDILSYIDKKINHEFVACDDCKGCVFTNTINMLDGYVRGEVSRFEEYPHPIEHEEFI